MHLFLLLHLFQPWVNVRLKKKSADYEVYKSNLKNAGGIFMLCFQGWSQNFPEAVGMTGFMTRCGVPQSHQSQHEAMQRKRKCSYVKNKLSCWWSSCLSGPDVPAMPSNKRGRETCFLESLAEGHRAKDPTGSFATPASHEEGKLFLMKAGEVLGSNSVCGSGIFWHMGYNMVYRMPSHKHTTWEKFLFWQRFRWIVCFWQGNQITSWALLAPWQQS